MAPRKVRKPKKHKQVEPKRETAEAWRRRITRQTGKIVRVVPGSAGEH